MDRQALPRPLCRNGQPTIVTVGTFDGVHLGHRAILAEISARAAASGGRSVLVTFDPHPMQVIEPSRAPGLLTTLSEKKPLLAQSGLDYAVVLAFTPLLRQYSPERFVKEALLDGLGMTELVIGHDHGFGKGRSGNAETLRSIAAQQGFALDVFGPVRAGGAAVSSSSIRKALAEGRVRDASRSLGRRYSIAGTVVRGAGRGRELGFPTANLSLAKNGKLLPREGVYACWATLAQGRFMGAMHIGARPVFPGASATVEVHLLDWEGDAYGSEIEVALVEYVRPVAAFGSVPRLVAQMREDVRQCRQILGCAGAKPGLVGLGQRST